MGKRLLELGDVVEISGKEGRFVLYKIEGRSNAYWFVPEEYFSNVNFIDANGIKKNATKIKENQISDKISLVKAAGYHLTVTNCIMVSKS